MYKFNMYNSFIDSKYWECRYTKFFSVFYYTQFHIFFFFLVYVKRGNYYKTLAGYQLFSKIFYDKLTKSLF